MVDLWTRTIVIAGILPSLPLQTSEIPPVNSIRISPSSQTRIFCPARRKTSQKRRSSPRISTVHETCPLYFCGPRFRRNNPPVSSSLRVACFLRGPQDADNCSRIFDTGTIPISLFETLSFLLLASSSTRNCISRKNACSFPLFSFD